MPGTSRCKTWKVGQPGPRDPYVQLVRSLERETDVSQTAVVCATRENSVQGESVTRGIILSGVGGLPPEEVISNLRGKSQEPQHQDRDM